MTAFELRRALARDDDLVLVDVREPGEHELMSIPGDVLIPQQEILTGRARDRLPREVPLVLYCKTGARSAQCLVALRRDGFTDVRHLEGGVLAWAEQIEPALGRY